jgi:hypothetical protein
MRSFAAIATFATLAFSAVTSALPTPDGGIVRDIVVFAVMRFTNGHLA